MLQAHSFVWHYLWVAPDLLQLVLCFFLWQRRLIRDFPAFFAFALITAISELVLYAADVLPFVSALTYWKMTWATEIISGVLKFAVIGEIFSKLFGRYASVARLGRILIQWVGATSVFGAVLTAAYAPKYQFAGITTGADLLLQSMYLIECGALVFIFLFASYFHLRWPRQVFGIALGLGASACVYLATWGLINNAALPAAKRHLLVLINGSAFHLEVLIWFYYLLVPQHTPVQIPASLPENNLALWNRELERLLHQ
jgi:hypothetical protein